MTLESRLATLGALLEDRAAKHGVVGAALAVRQGGELPAICTRETGQRLA